jgi:hypothetical protein
MADEKGFIDTDKIAEFKPTMGLRYEERYITKPIASFWPVDQTIFEGRFLQQKWTNELGEEEWRDIPLAISDL